MAEKNLPKFKLKMLYHTGFWDYPQDGIAELNGERVYFTVENAPDVVNKYDLDEKAIDEITKLECQYREKLYSFLPKDFDPEEIGIYKGYEIFSYDRFVVRKRLSYKVYRLPSNILEEYEVQTKEFNEYVGYHTWHDPAMYKPYTFTGRCDEFYHKKKKGIEGFNVDNFEYLGSFYDTDFQYFSRPFSPGSRID